jgi:hypothetical protein
VVATGHVTTPEHDHDGVYAEPDHGHEALLLVSEPGTRWFLTTDPFNPLLVAQLVTGDRFSYPVGHAQERETYRWNGASWAFDSTLPAVPASTDAVVITAGLPEAVAITPAANMTNGTTGVPTAQEIVPGWIALSGRLQATSAGSGNQQIGTLPAGHFPDTEVRPTVRFIGTGASSGSVTIGTNGVMTYNTALPLSGEVPLSGILFRKA